MLLTVGVVVGSGVFLTGGDIAGTLPHPGLILTAWVVGGLIAVAGALTYGELGAMFPRAGGPYQYLKEAYGPLWGFLNGWVSFWVIWSGAVAALAAGFGEFLGVFLPLFGTQRVWVELSAFGGTLAITGGQVAGALAVLLFTAINYVGVREGVLVQNLLALLKIGAVVALAVAGLMAPARVELTLLAPLPEGPVVAGFGMALIGVLWSLGGWFAATNVAGEMRDPARALPRGMAIGVVVVTLLYLLVTVVFLRALPMDELIATPRAGEAAATALFGPSGGRLLAAAVVLSMLGAMSSNLLAAARIYQPMAADGIFFRRLARIHPRYHTPSTSLLAQAAWILVLVFTGSYRTLFVFVMFIYLLTQVATGCALFRLRATRPAESRPYRVWGYPLVPLLFIVTSALVALATAARAPLTSLAGFGLLAAGLPAYWWWRRGDGGDGGVSEVGGDR